MAMSEKTKTALSAAVDPMKAKEHEIIEQYLEQLHADYDPVYSMLLNYECAVMEVETKFNILNNRLSIQGEQNPIESIKSRVKSLDSIIRKLEKLNLPIELESVEKNLKDVAGVRVVCSFVDDIYRIEKCFLEQEDVTLITRKDYIKKKKDMFVEVQMRTIAMDFWASLEHKLRYKKNLNPRTAEELAEELAACAEESAALDERMLRVRERIAQD